MDVTTLPATVAERREMLAACAVSRISPALREDVLKVIAEVPDEFFTAPASSSGKHHPLWALGDGGLMRHTLAVVQVCEHLMRLHQTEPQKKRDCVYAAAILHDSMKGWDGMRWRGPTAAAHGEYAAQLWERVVGNRDWRDAVIRNMLRTHMVQWAECCYAFSMQAPEVQLLATADYVASRRDLLPPFASVEAEAEPSDVGDSVD